MYGNPSSLTPSIRRKRQIGTNFSILIFSPLFSCVQKLIEIFFFRDFQIQHFSNVYLACYIYIWTWRK